MRKAMEYIEHYEKLSESKNRYRLFYNTSARHEHHGRQFLKFYLSQQLFTFKEFCIVKRLSDISKTTNVTKLTEALLIMSFRVLKKSPCLIFCMIFEEKCLSCYILLTE